MTMSTLNADTGTMTINLAVLPPDALGELLRTHVYGGGKGYRDTYLDESSPYKAIADDDIPADIVDEMLGDPETRDDFMKVTAWSDGPLTIATACDGDTTLLFRIALPTGVRTIVNHDAKHDYGWDEA